MVALFKDRSPATVFWLILLSLIVHSHFFVELPVVQANNATGLLAVFLNRYLSSSASGVIAFIYHAIIILQALRLNHLLTDNRMFSRVNYLPAMIYILLTGVFAEWSTLNPAVIINGFIIWFFARLVRLYNTPNPKTAVFNIGLLTGLTILLFHPSALLIPVAFFALMVLRPFIVTEYVVLLIGIIFPYYLLASYLYLTDQFMSVKNHIPLFQIHLPPVGNKTIFFITISAIAVILIYGLAYWRQENRKLLIQIRKNWTVLLSMLVFLLPLILIYAASGIDTMVLTAVPASAIVARGFLAAKRNTVPALMFWMLMSLAILKNWHFIQDFRL